MKRYLVAIFSLLIFSLAGWMDDITPDVQNTKAATELKQASQGERERDILKEFGNDMLRTATESLCVVQHSITHHTQNNLRHRSNHSPKSNIHTMPSQHIGHATDIFDYTLKTSSQRDDYYLHTLCRLRI